MTAAATYRVTRPLPTCFSLWSGAEYPSQPTTTNKMKHNKNQAKQKVYSNTRYEDNNYLFRRSGVSVRLPLHHICLALYRYRSISADWIRCTYCNSVQR